MSISLKEPLIHNLSKNTDSYPKAGEKAVKMEAWRNSWKSLNRDLRPTVLIDLPQDQINANILMLTTDEYNL